MESMEKVLYEAVVCPGVRIEGPEGVKPWQSEDIQRLILERRSCNNSTERTNISKKIQKMTRAILRKHQNKKRIQNSARVYWVGEVTKSIRISSGTKNKRCNNSV